MQWFDDGLGWGRGKHLLKDKFCLLWENRKDDSKGLSHAAAL